MNCEVDSPQCKSPVNRLDHNDTLSLAWSSYGAIQGGFDHQNRSLFICRAKYKQRIIPGQLSSRTGQCHVAIRGVRSNKIKKFPKFQLLIKPSIGNYQWKSVKWPAHRMVANVIIGGRKITQINDHILEDHNFKDHDLDSRNFGADLMEHNFGENFGDRHTGGQSGGQSGDQSSGNLDDYNYIGRCYVYDSFNSKLILLIGQIQWDHLMNQFICKVIYSNQEIVCFDFDVLIHSD